MGYTLQQGMTVLRKSIIEFLMEIAPVSDELANKILAIDDFDILQQLNKKAPRVTSHEEFEKLLG